MKSIKITVFALFVSLIGYSQNAATKQTVMVKMPDGVQLSTDIFSPEKEGVYPVILIRTPYNKIQHQEEGYFFANNNYIVIIQDSRGSFESEGEMTPFLNEEKDGLATLDWILDQKWCNGNVGLWGSSYLSYAAFVIAQHNPKAIKSLFVISGWLKGDKVLHPGGTFHLQLSLPWMLYSKSFKGTEKRYDYKKLFKTTPTDSLFDALGIYANFLKERRAGNSSFDANYKPKNIKAPMFHITGWNDFVKDAHLDLYGKTKNSKSLHKLMIGPWGHDQIYTDKTTVGDEDFGSQSVLGRTALNKLGLNWFDYTLKGKSNSIDDKAATTVFVMGENSWRTFDNYPPKEVRNRKFYLSSTNGANGVQGDGQLLSNPKSQNSIDHFTYNPHDPVPTFGGANFHFFPSLLGVKNRAEIQKRSDVLVYTGEALKEDLVVIGNVKVNLNVATQGKDTDFTATLSEVQKDGYVRIISEGIIRLGNRKGVDQRTLVSPGTFLKVSIDMGNTGIKIKKGNQLRLEVSSSNFPKYDRNPNTGVDPFEASTFISVEQSVRLGKNSFLTLPVLK